MSDIKQYEPLWGSWHVDSMIGEGSFGKVYRVKREEFGKTYYSAVKIISIPQNEADFRQMKSEGLDDASVKSYFRAFVSDIMQEIELMSEFRGNSNIVSFEDHKVIERSDPIGWDILIRMELLTSLTEYATEKSLSSDDVIKLGINICHALELCALKNTIHRDIKPDNIFVSQYGDYKLGDFGIARQIERTMSGLSKKGTYTYMAPEVFKGEKYGSSVDTYSLGIVMYRLLNQNRTPFLPDFPSPIMPRDRDNAMERRIGGEALPEINGIATELSAIVCKACAYDRNQRYKSATEMREALEAVAGSHSYAPVSASSPQKQAVSPPAHTPKAPVYEQTTGTEATAGVFGSKPLYSQPKNSEKTSGTEGVWDSAPLPKAPAPQKKKNGGKIFAAISAASVLVFVIISTIIVSNWNNHDQQSLNYSDKTAPGEADAPVTTGSLPIQSNQPEVSAESVPSQSVSEITDTKIAVYMTSDGEVDLSSTGIVDISEYDIPEEVVTLRLSDNSISELPSLQAFTQLTSLALSGNNITNIVPLTGLAGIENISLNDNQISNISPLNALVNLKSLYLDGNPLTQEQVDALRLALPNCKIYWKNPNSVPSEPPTTVMETPIAPIATPTPTSSPTPPPSSKSYSKGDTLTFGSYNGKPITWIVLDVTGDKAFLISKNILTNRLYYGYFADTNGNGEVNYPDEMDINSDGTIDISDVEQFNCRWETSDIRKWLNGSFYNSAFTDAEKAKISNTSVSNKENAVYGTLGGNDTNDKVFLLSIDEVNNYFSSDIARSAGAWWWLRSTGEFGSYSAFVESDGMVFVYGDGVLYSGGVRPVLRLNLES